MSTLLIYMVKVAAYLAAFYLIYSLMLSRDTTFSRNRAYILISVAAALLFPLIKFQTVKPLDIQFFGKLLSDVFVTASHDGTDSIIGGLLASGSLQIIYQIYVIGVIALFFKLLIDLLNLLFLIVRQKNKDSIIIRYYGLNTAGFSAMGYIFVSSKLSPEEAREIIRHEQNHLRQNHFLDILFIELVKAIQWFNPVVYLLNRALRAIHEFQADQDCLSSGVPMVSYQSLLLSQVFRSKAFNLTNSFSNPSLVKKRIVMMTKKRTTAIAGVKLLLVVPVTALVFFVISAFKEDPNSSVQQIVSITEPYASVSPLTDLSTQPQKTSEPVSKPSFTKPSSGIENNVALPPPPPPPPQPDENKVTAKVSEEEAPFVVVEEMPMFPGGDPELLKHIAENTIYPENAKVQNIQGRVIIRFCVTATGGVSQISVLKGVSPDLDAEAMRVVATLPEFKPGRQGGKAVPVWYMVPITFTLK
jgi:TonB family protein